MINPSKMPNLFIFFFFLLPFIFCNFSEAARRGALTGGWTKITDVTSPTVIDIGKFAIDEHNKKDQTSLKFSKVVCGEQQVVAGMNYNLTITAADGVGGSDNNYVAVVWDQPWMKNSRRLTAFRGPV